MSARFVLSVAIFAILSRTAPLTAQEDHPGKMRQVVYPVADLVVPVVMDNTKPQRKSATLEDTLLRLILPNVRAEYLGGRRRARLDQVHAQGNVADRQPNRDLPRADSGVARGIAQAAGRRD